MNLLATIICVSVLLAFIVQLIRNILLPLPDKEWQRWYFVEATLWTLAKAVSVLWFVSLLLK